MIHRNWEQKETLRKVKCIHTDAKKYLVNNMLTVGHTYEVKNETDEFLFVIDNSGNIGGYYKTYFETV
ncbi:DUF6501 family protein [Sutcliffiella rhizosphaerae]|uniref:Uncharacterized protein n=1 Tax=Sutcliffiella rhizosphaerae TaxID=2880967 RepID=A0ABM8YPG3_9BACI|nr:DUF6501 family protein [Sutcliffiella rhizosphaerae]CAG9621684.1 hypothetical protein BACCIP111883_02457 [Sutcliffiella rhizosphaerae]